MKKPTSKLELPIRLFDGGAVQIDTEKGFRLKLHDTNPDAPLSPIFVNFRTPDNPKPGPLTPELVEYIGKALWVAAKTAHMKFDAIAGLPNAGTPLAEAMKNAAYNDGLFLPLVVLGKTTTEQSRKIEGLVDDGGAKQGEIVLVVDDLITRGDSKNEGIEALRKAGFKVNDVLVVVDREQGGGADLTKLGVKLHSITTLESIVTTLYRYEKISEKQLDTVRHYLDNHQ